MYHLHRAHVVAVARRGARAIAHASTALQSESSEAYVPTACATVTIARQVPRFTSVSLRNTPGLTP